MSAGSDLAVASRLCVGPRTLLDEFPGISSCRSWTRLLTARCCAVLVMVQTAQLCAVLDKVVDLPVIVQVQGMVQTVQISCSSWTRSLTCPLLCSLGYRRPDRQWQLCAVLDKVVELPVIVQVQDAFGLQTVQISCSSWTRSLTCPLLCNDRPSLGSDLRRGADRGIVATDHGGWSQHAFPPGVQLLDSGC